MILWRKPWVGVDIGSRTIKGIKLKRRGKQVVLDRYFFHDLLSTSPYFPEQPNIEETLKADVELNKLASLPTSVNIRDEDVFNLTFSLPPMNDKDMRLAVGHEIQESLNMPIEELSFDYVVAEKDQAKASVKVYCAKKDVISSRIELLGKSTLKAAAAESDMLAIFEMLKFNDYIDGAKTAAVFDIGESHVGTGLIVAGQLTAVKTNKLALGGINQALIERLKMNYSAAEQLKLAHDLGQTDAPETSESQVIDQVYFDIFKEAKEHVDFFNESNSPGHSNVEQLILVGGGSQIPHIKKVFELLFKVPVTIANPLKNIHIFDKKHSNDAAIAKVGPHLAAAVGLALRDIA